MTDEATGPITGALTDLCDWLARVLDDGTPVRAAAPASAADGVDVWALGLLGDGGRPDGPIRLRPGAPRTSGRRGQSGRADPAASAASRRAGRLADRRGHRARPGHRRGRRRR